MFAFAEGNARVIRQGGEDTGDFVGRSNEHGRSIAGDHFDAVEQCEILFRKVELPCPNERIERSSAFRPDGFEVEHHFPFGEGGLKIRRENDGDFSFRAGGRPFHATEGLWGGRRFGQITRLGRAA